MLRVRLSTAAGTAAMYTCYVLTGTVGGTTSAELH